MSITTITIGANNYVSYASRAEANVVLSIDPVRRTVWNALTDDDDTKGPFLVAATQRLDLFDYQGDRTGDPNTQTNKWPRTGVTYPDGTAVSTSEVPFEIERATILLAGSIAIDAAQAETGTSGSNIERVKAGSAEVTFFRPEAGRPIQDETVHDLIKLFLESGRLDVQVGPVAFGTDGESEFLDPDSHCRTRGFP